MYFEVTADASLETYKLITAEEALPPDVFVFAFARSAESDSQDGPFTALFRGAADLVATGARRV